MSYTKKDQEMWRDENIDILFKENLPRMIQRNEITKENMQNFIVPYIGNDFSKLSKDIDRNIYLLKNILTFITVEKYDISFIRDFVKTNLILQVNLLEKLIRDDHLEYEPRDFIPKIDDNIIFEILFVRHGIGCNNVTSYEIKTQNSYFDPELTTRGIERSIELYSKLSEKINTFFKSSPYSIIASSLMRTQETAYFMLAKHVKKPINISPHIAERGQSYSNYQLPKKEQQKIFNNIDPDIVKYLNLGKDDRDSQDIRTKSYPEMFYHWANTHLDFFELGPSLEGSSLEGSDNIYRAVVFTHGGYFDNAFKINPENNDILYTTINKNNYKKPPFEFFRVKPLTTEDKEIESNCRIK
jgi:broad specificity phosphatase PhoE|uniref:Uncharacterized protein n=1 Tax=viral metagenome TaxID=1070528 RepID=A0A6C0H0F0_9ZZZZ